MGFSFISIIDVQIELGSLKCWWSFNFGIFPVNNQLVFASPCNRYCISSFFLVVFR